jgi:hypothetical protein
MSASPAFADFISLNRSSFTATNDTTQRICATPCVLDSVVVSSPSVGGLLTIYDSNAAASNKIAVVNTANSGSYRFEVLISSGLTYTTANNTNGITILWRK